MSSSGRTLLSVLADRTTTPFSIALGLGFTASSYFTFANVGLNFFGPVRMIVNDKKRKEIGLDTNIGKCIEIWANFYESATPHMAGSAVVASLSFLTAALLLPTSSGWILPKQLRNVLFASSVCYTFIPVWTLIKMMPTNKALQALRDQIVHGRTPNSIVYSKSQSEPEIYGPVENLNSTQEAQGLSMIKKWNEMHKARLGASIAGWVLAFVGFTCAY